MKRIGFVLTAVLFLLLPLLAFAGGAQESEPGMTEDDVVMLINKNQVDFGTSFGETCGACHGRGTKYPVAGAVESYEHSGHNLGYEKEAQNSWYANGNGCQQCHTSEGFTEYVDNGELVSEFIAYPSQLNCFTCHNPHETGDFSLVTTAPVTLNNGATFDKGSGNLCANCHQARSDVAASVKAVPAKDTPPRGAGHHGPNADVFMGTNAYEFPGKSYSSSAHTQVIDNACVTCHLALPEGRYSMSPEVGGHSFYIGGEVHGAEKLNVAACNSCHTEIGQEGNYFDIKREDWDNDGILEPVQAEVKGLLEILVNENGNGLLQTTPIPLFNAGGSTARSSSEEMRSVEEIAALQNYLMFLEDRSLGIHNTKYTVQILYDTIKGIDPGFNTSKRP